ncbi:hypothetical protein KAI04_04235 [Candidatus Pacearchaeota archaeon]|nr:hypothetical protein [Candidatus Pacearchaeota archaeon]
MICEYCRKELPQIINGKREVCSCSKANEDWKLSMRIEHLKKQLSQANKELSNLKEKTEVEDEA